MIGHEPVLWPDPFLAGSLGETTFEHELSGNYQIQGGSSLVSINPELALNLNPRDPVQASLLGLHLAQLKRRSSH